MSEENNNYGADYDDDNRQQQQSSSSDQQGDNNYDSKASGEAPMYSKPPENVDKLVSLKISEITSDTTADELKAIFSKYGEVRDVFIPR